MYALKTVEIRAENEIKAEDKETEVIAHLTTHEKLTTMGNNKYAVKHFYLTRLDKVLVKHFNRFP